MQNLLVQSGSLGFAKGTLLSGSVDDNEVVLIDYDLDGDLDVIADLGSSPGSPPAGSREEPGVKLGAGGLSWGRRSGDAPRSEPGRRTAPHFLEPRPPRHIFANRGSRDSRRAVRKPNRAHPIPSPRAPEDPIRCRTTWTA